MSKHSSLARPLAEPYLLFMIFVGVGLGAIMLTQPARLALMWTTLAILCLLYRAKQEVDLSFTLPGLGRGALLGLVIAAPVLAFLAEPLRAFNERLYGTRDVVLLFYQTCFIAAPLEGYFLRGIVQSSKGASVSIALAAATALLYFLPHAPILIAFIVFVVMGGLSIVYTYVCDRYGLASSIACHVVVSFLLQVAPSLIALARRLLS